MPSANLAPAPRRVVAALMVAAFLSGCATTTSPKEEAGTSSPAESAASGATSVAPSRPATLGHAEQSLEAGTYRLDLTALAGGDAYPSFLVTVPEGWTSPNGWALNRGTVAITFWNVDKVYAHPCQWRGALFQPGPGVEELAAALVEVPMRSATKAVAVQIDGHNGKYLEWSVPANLPFNATGFPDCDGDAGGPYDFKSWTAKGWNSTRYHQAPGQIDRLWILDVGGQRLVIDAFSMPDTTTEEIAELKDVVQSIQFDDK